MAIFQSGVDSAQEAVDVFRAPAAPPPLTAEEQINQAYELYNSGFMTPEQFEAVLQKPSLLTAYKGDPRLRESQMRALGDMEEIAKKGFSVQDLAAMERMNTQNRAEAKGARDALVTNAQRRGVGGSGLELGATLANQQNAATRAHLAALDTAARGEARRMAATKSAADLAGGIRGQGFAEAEARAKAQDAIERFNTQNRNVAGAANVEAANRAKEEARGLSGGQYDREEKRRQSISDALLGKSAAEAEAGKGDAGFFGSLIGAGGTIAGAFASDIDAKEDIQPAEEDLDQFLSSLNAEKWRYKQPEKHGEGTKYGVMAQDMEKSPVGRSMVSEDPEGTKRIDYGSAQGVMMAILADMNDRLKGVENAK
jgi:hypothetical protein